MVNKKRGRPKGKKNAPSTTSIPLYVLNILVGEDEFVDVSIKWLSDKRESIKNSLPEVKPQQELEQKVKYKITQFNESE